MFYIGIDIGTSNIKVLLFSTEFGIIDFDSLKLSFFRETEDCYEQDPNEWIEKAVFLINKILLRNKNSISKIKAIGFSGQMHGLVALDNKGNVVRRCMTWMDHRAKEEIHDIRKKIDIFKITGNLADPSFTLPKILWLKKNEKNNYERSRCFFQPKDYLRYRFGKNKPLITDKTDASATLLMNIKNQNWSEEVLNIFNLDSNKLPEIRNSYEIVDHIGEEIAEKTGLNKNVLLVTGAGDQEAAAVGLNIVEENESFISCGTGGQIFRPTKKLILNKDSGVNFFCHPLKGWHYLGAIQNAGNVIEWITKLLNIDYEFIERIDLKEKNNLYFLPYLTGERTPVMDENSKGMWMGINISHKKKDLVQSVLEGISFSLKLAYSKIIEILGEDEACYLIGGITKSKQWTQMLTNIIGKKLKILDIYEGSAYGAALLSALGCGDINENKLSHFKPHIKKVFFPEEKISNYYEQKYMKFLKMIELEKKFRE